MNYYAHQTEVISEKDRPDRKFFGNWRGTGSGKTRTTVAICEGPTLVLCPKIQAEEEIWEKEWASQGRDPHEIIVLSFEQFKKKYLYDPECVFNFRRPQTIVIDEAHRVAGIQPSEFQKNYVKYPRRSQIFDAVYGYIQRVRPDRIHPLTATPAPNPMAVFALGLLLGRDWDYHKFRAQFYIEKEVRGRRLWIVNRSKANKELIQRTIRTIGYTGSLSDWFDVPDQTFKIHEVGTTSAQEDCFDELKLLYPDPLVQTGKRQMLEQGLFEGGFLTENKTDAIDAYMQEFGKVIVFCRYTDQIAMYQNLLGKKYKVLTLTGATKKRDEVLAEARAADECLFIAQCQISAGWELPDFPCMVFASLDYSFVNFDQAIGRILRSNALKKNLYVFLIAGDGDDRVHKVVQAKEDFVSEAAFARKYGKELCEKKKLRSPRA